uniref:Uncharacterized protein n=1 Tax=Arundo donax TaxID=35708 RepID=A0A0A9H4R1_ARUDO
MWYVESFLETNCICQDTCWLMGWCMHMFLLLNCC